MSIIDEAETIVREFESELRRVRAGECLCCYVAHQLQQSGCDGSHRHALRFRDAMAPRATALRARLSRVGACCCDCELFLNGYVPHVRFWTPAHEEVAADGVRLVFDAEPPDDPPPCAGVRRGTVRPCVNWERIRRW